MSHNIYIGRDMFSWQTPTHVTDRILAASTGAGALEQDLRAIDLLEEWVFAACGPEPLKGKDARNPYLTSLFDEEVDEIKERIELYREFVRSHSNGKSRLVTRG